MMDCYDVVSGTPMDFAGYGKEEEKVEWSGELTPGSIEGIGLALSSTKI